MKEEKTGSVSELIFHNEDNFYTIAIFETEDEQFCAVGNMPMPKKARRYRLTGEWTVHPKYGEQFVFSSFEELEPTTEEGIIAFLASGVIKGVGPSTALSIVKKFGEDTLKVLKEYPERLREVSGIGELKAKAIAAGYQEHMEYADTVLKLSAFDVSASVALKLYKAYGAAAVDIVKENPYRLIEDVYGIGFQKADKIAEKVGIAPDSPNRIKSGILYALNARINSGDTYSVKTEFIESCAQLLDVTREQCTEALFELIMNGDVYSEVIDGREVLMLWRYYKAEKHAAKKLYELCHAELTAIPAKHEKLIAKAEREKDIKLSEKQKLAVISSLRNGVSVITGGPGTGKTTIINAILAILKEGGISTALAAPTGRAAKRMTQATGCEASTIHRLLEYTYSESDDSMHFGKTEESPLDFSCIIIDEMSMVDILLMDGLLSAIKPGSRLILVGDADQLPPVGAGNVLKDIISSDTIHCVRLTEIFRQAEESMIVVNAHLINKGEYPSFNGKDTDFFFLERENETAIQKTISELCSSRLPNYFKDIDRFEGIQVLTPTRKGKLGCVELNKVLQAVLNPPDDFKNEKKIGDTIYREGDKVMQNKNDYMLEWKDLNDFTTHTGVFNGDIGIIKSVDNDAGTVSVLYDGDKLAVYDYANLDELETAFALTVHKSQGSEFPIVVMPMSSFPPMLASRNLFYTAVTRARQSVVLVGNPEYAKAMTDNNQITKRYSGLCFRLKKMWESFE